MILFFGTYVINRVLATFTLECPQCMGPTEARVRRGRLWFHLFWIPVIPLTLQPEHVQCTRCRSMFALGILGDAADQFRRQPRAAGAVPEEQVPAGQVTDGRPAAGTVRPVPVEDSAEWARRNDLG